MANLIKIKIKKGKDQFNTVLLNLDKITRIEQISNRISFTIVSDKSTVTAEYDSAEDAKTFFDKLHSDF